MCNSLHKYAVEVCICAYVCMDDLVTTLSNMGESKMRIFTIATTRGERENFTTAEEQESELKFMNSY